MPPTRKAPGAASPSPGENPCISRSFAWSFCRRAGSRGFTPAWKPADSAVRRFWNRRPGTRIYALSYHGRGESGKDRRRLFPGHSGGGSIPGVPVASASGNAGVWEIGIMKIRSLLFSSVWTQLKDQGVAGRSAPQIPLKIRHPWKDTGWPPGQPAVSAGHKNICSWSGW